MMLKRVMIKAIFKRVTRKLINGVWKATCIYCQKNLSSGTRNGTTHLQNHTKICIQRSRKDIKQALLNTKVASNGKFSVEKHMFEQKEVRKELASMIILHEYPLSMVEHVGFRHFTSSLQPLFKAVSRNTIKKDIFEIYDFEKAKTMSLLETSKSRLAITTDMWTSSNQKKGFML
ncbi:zinc finger BED domain-containing protein RICESLEEPER 3-like [Rutidosis leptorrhynchoides]|uniref:zinc finger BED domain-containing protein RICESLEEPER 3-like n=1 Tax=Rutidosis leptorrhynchoides TaxID=125765 RepID=UPI003A99550E